METKNISFNHPNEKYNYEIIADKQIDKCVYEKRETCRDKYGCFIVYFMSICVFFTILFIILKLYF